MKIFWSWQSDTPANIGRHFVRNALAEAIEILEQRDEIEESSERQTLHPDHDRKGVSGSHNLASNIFKKIERAAVFVADVTVVGKTTAAGNENGAAKRLVNSFVAIEYGYALRSLGAQRILTVQNQHFGGHGDLPFDITHKTGPIRYALAPDATPAQINVEKARLKAHFVDALRPYLSLDAPKAEFEETRTTSSPAFFFNSSEVLARVGTKGIREIEYRFCEPRVFYLRLIPTRALPQALNFVELHDLVQQRRLDVLSRVPYAVLPNRNRFGAIAYEPLRTSATLSSFTQAFTNGELWGITTECFVRRQNKIIISPANIDNIYSRVLENFCSMAKDGFGIEPPYWIELGATGLSDTHLGINPYDSSGPIHRDHLSRRRKLQDVTAGAQQKLIGVFMDALFDLVGEDRQTHLLAAQAKVAAANMPRFIAKRDARRLAFSRFTRRP